MNIALIANDKKKELLAEFCTAYCGVFSKHNLCATAGTARIVSEATGLEIEKLLPGQSGGNEQIASRISFDEIDMLIYFRDGEEKPSEEERIETELIRVCDLHSVLLATNIAVAEILVRAIEGGDLDYYNDYRQKKEIKLAVNGRKE